MSRTRTPKAAAAVLLLAAFAASARDAGGGDPPGAARLLERFGSEPDPHALVEAVHRRIDDPPSAVAESERGVRAVERAREATLRGDLEELADATLVLAEELERELGPDHPFVERERRRARELGRIAALGPERRAAAARALALALELEDVPAQTHDDETLAASVAEVREWERAGLAGSPLFADAAMRRALEHFARLEFAEAERMARRGLAAALPQARVDRTTAILLRCLGQSLDRIGGSEASYRSLLRALEIELALPYAEPDRLLAALSDLGSAALHGGRDSTALACGEAAVRLARASFPPESAPAVSAESLLALALQQFGRATEAEAVLRGSADALRAEGASVELRQHVQQTLAEILERKGDLEGAREMKRRALDLATRLYGEEHPLVGWAAFSLADVERQLGADDRARRLLERAVGIFERRGMEGLVARLRSRLLAGSSRPDRAEGIRALLEARRGEGGDLTRARLAVDLGAVLFEERDHEGALTAAARALAEVAAAGGSADGQVASAARVVEGSSLLALGRVEEAVARLTPVHARQAEFFRHGPRRADPGARHIDRLSLASLSGLLARASIESGRVEDAFDVAEAIVERPLLELLRGSGAETGAAQRGETAPLSAAEARASLGADEALVVHLWSKHAVSALVLRRDAATAGVVLVAGEDAVLDLRRRVERLAGALARGGEADAGASAARLAEELLPGAVRAALPEEGRVLWVPSGPLNALPLDLLLVPEGGLLAPEGGLLAPEGGLLAPEGAALPVVARAPSATVLARARRGAAPARETTALLVGDPAYPRSALLAGVDPRDLARAELFDGFPRLPGTRAEVDGIAEVLERARGRPRVLAGERASRAELERAVDGRSAAPRYLHLAVHGRSGSDASPRDAALALAPDRPDGEGDGAAPSFLTLDDLLSRWRGRLEGNELTVLSACETQRGVAVGDSWMALSWGFLAAGSPSVVATLWKVDDRAASLLMRRFYENLLGAFDEPRSAGGRAFAAGERLPKAEALAEAKGWLRAATLEELARIGERSGPGAARGGAGPEAVDPTRLRPYAEPRYWASFVLIGSPD